MDLAALLAAVPTLPGYEVQQSDDMQLEVTLQKGQELNDVFAQLTQSGVGVVSRGPSRTA